MDRLTRSNWPPAVGLNFPRFLKSPFFCPDYFARSPLDTSCLFGLWRVATPTLALFSIVATLRHRRWWPAIVKDKSPTLSVSLLLDLYFLTLISQGSTLILSTLNSHALYSGSTVCPSTTTYWLLLTIRTRLESGHRTWLGTGQWTQSEVGSLGIWAEPVTCYWLLNASVDW